MSKFEKLYKQICYTRTLRGLNNLLSATLGGKYPWLDLHQQD
jgi:hypothetical protein